MNGRWMTLLLIVASIASAVAVVQTKQHNRALVSEMAGLRADRERMQVEWAQLQLEDATLAQHGRVEQFARDKLGMSEPDHYEIVGDRP